MSKGKGLRGHELSTILFLALMLLTCSRRVQAKISLNLGAIAANWFLSDDERASRTENGRALTDLAIDQLERAMEFSNDIGTVSLILAEVYRAKGSYLTAAKVVESIPDGTIPADARNLRLGEYYWMADETTSSLVAWERMADPLHSLLDYCDKYLALGEYEKATLYCEVATAMEPRHGWANYFLARAYRAQGDEHHAKVVIQKAIQSEPEVIRYRLFLAEVLLQLGETSAAIAEYEDILEMDPDNTEAGQVLLDLQDHE